MNRVAGWNCGNHGDPVLAVAKERVKSDGRILTRNGCVTFDNDNDTVTHNACDI